MKIDVQKLSPQSGDILVFRHPRGISAKDRHEFQAAAQHIAGAANCLWVTLPDDLSLQKVGGETLADLRLARVEDHSTCFQAGVGCHPTDCPVMTGPGAGELEELRADNARLRRENAALREMADKGAYVVEAGATLRIPPGVTTIGFVTLNGGTLVQGQPERSPAYGLEALGCTPEGCTAASRGSLEEALRESRDANWLIIPEPPPGRDFDYRNAGRLREDLAGPPDGSCHKEMLPVPLLAPEELLAIELPDEPEADSPVHVGPVL